MAPEGSATPGDAADHSPDDAPPPPALDLRVARVLAASEHPNADRLLLLRVDLGDEERQLVAGIAGRYALADLEGMRVVVVANLKPATLRGETSQGMVLAAESEDGTLGLVRAPSAEPGTRVATASAPEPTGQIDIDDFARHELEATAEGVLIDGEPVAGVELVVDRGVVGRVR